MCSGQCFAATPRNVFAFGHLRIKAWLAAPRSLTQPSHVLHRLPTPKHPPCTLRSLTTFILECRRACARRHHGNLSLRSRKSQQWMIPRFTCQRSDVFGHRSEARSHRERRHKTRIRCAAELVEATGLEPATFSLQRRRSTS